MMAVVMAGMVFNCPLGPPQLQPGTQDITPEAAAVQPTLQLTMAVVDLAVAETVLDQALKARPQVQLTLAAAQAALGGIKLR
jgi:hypothetical protein